MVRQDRVIQLRAALDRAGVPHYHNESHIVPVMVGDAWLCKQVTDRLLGQIEIYVQSINYPTVPRGTERLRITPTPFHSDADIAYLVTSLSLIWSDLRLQWTRDFGSCPTVRPSMLPDEKSRPKLELLWRPWGGHVAARSALRSIVFLGLRET